MKVVTSKNDLVARGAVTNLQTIMDYLLMFKYFKKTEGY